MFRLWAALVIVIAVNDLSVQGSTCYKEDGRAGRCMDLKKCKVSLTTFNKCGLRPDKCETGSQRAEVCCPKHPLRIKERPIDYSCITNTYSRRGLGIAVTDITLYPHAAALGYATSKSKEYAWKCGGTLIHLRFVLTAAHCLMSTDLKVVLLGAPDVLDVHNPYSQTREVDRVITHPEYGPNKRYNDIGLVRLKEDIEETVYVSPACLLTTPSTPTGEVTTIGWGVGDNDAPQEVNQKKVLREAKMSMIQCPNYREAVTLRNHIICAKGTTHAACSGDSGGPLHVYFKDTDMLYVMGVYSYGSGRCTSNTPSRFIRLTPYLDWIEREVWTPERCVYDHRLLQ